MGYLTAAGCACRFVDYGVTVALPGTVRPLPTPVNAPKTGSTTTMPAIRLIPAVLALALVTACTPTQQQTAAPAPQSGAAEPQPEAAPAETVSEAPAETPAAAAAPAPAWLAETFGDELVLRDGSTVDTATLAGKTLGIYFSAHWCPPCRTFTPKLVKARDQLVGEKKTFEVVFVSGDRDAKAMTKYMEETKMNWTAVPFASPKRDGLFKKFGVRGIPALVILDQDGKTVSKNARNDVASKGAAAFDGWR